jgi:hypothetical protein
MLLRKVSIILILLLQLSLAIAIEDPRKVGYALLSYSARGYFEILGEVKSLEANIKSIPQHELLDLSYDGKLLENDYLYLYLNYSTPRGKIEWDFSSKVRIKSELPKVEFISFPSFDYPKSIMPYLNFSEKANYFTEICKKASEITSGARSTAEAALRINDWVNANVKYEKVGDGVKSASWVFLNRKGVCSEFVNLFIAMARCVGIPARATMGYAYSNLEKKFGPHAWIEFWAGKWLPLDPTHGEAVVDATHLKFYHALDTSQAMMNMSYLGPGDVSHEGPTIGINLSEFADYEQLVSFDLELSKRRASDRDYILLKVNLSNPTSLYLLLSAYLAKTREMEIAYGSQAQGILLEPKGWKVVYYILKTPYDPACTYPNWICYHPIEIFVPFAGIKEEQIEVQTGYPAKTELESLLREIKMEEIKYKIGLEVREIKLSPNVTYQTKPRLSLRLRNVGNKLLENLSLGISYAGILISHAIGDLWIGQEKKVELELELLSQKGEFEIEVEISNGIEPVRFNLTLIVAEKPWVEISYLGEELIRDFEPLVFKLEFKQGGMIEKAEVLIDSPGGILKKELDFLREEEFSIPADFFTPGENRLRIVLKLYDFLGDEFIFEKEVGIRRETSNFLIYLYAHLKLIFLRLAKAFYKG